MTLSERSLAALNALERRHDDRQSPLNATDARAKLLVTFFYMAALLTSSLTEPLRILLFAVYPLLMSAIAGISHRWLFTRSLVAVPFIIVVVAFNPLCDHTPMFSIGEWVVTRGQLTLATTTLRGVLALEGLLILIVTTSAESLCRALRQMGAPALFTSQLLMMNRYIRLLIEESISMQRARNARSFGQRHYPLRLWAGMVGDLLLRSIARSERIQRAMSARGFCGDVVTFGTKGVWRQHDTLFLLAWGSLMVLIRLQPFIR